jgi:hypothetical protein
MSGNRPAGAELKIGNYGSHEGFSSHHSHDSHFSHPHYCSQYLRIVADTGASALNLQECRPEGEKKIVHRQLNMIRKAYVANKE